VSVRQTSPSGPRLAAVDPTAVEPDSEPAPLEQILQRDDLLRKSRQVVQAANEKMREMMSRLDQMQEAAAAGAPGVYAPESLDHQRNRIMKLQIEIDKYEAASKHLLEKRENIRSLMREPLIEAPR
jgi:flagellar biosynthesis chaperone FliJ